MRMNRLIASAAVVTALASGAAYATTVIIPDPGLSPDYAYFGSGDASVTYDGVIFSTSATLSNGNFYNIGPGYSDGDHGSFITATKLWAGEYFDHPAFARDLFFRELWDI